MSKQVFCLKFTRTTNQTPMILCIFEDEYQPIVIDKEIQDKIMSVIIKDFGWILTEFNLKECHIRKYLVVNKCQSFTFVNKSFNCHGKIFLDKINLY